MRLFLDCDRDKVITQNQLRAEFLEIKKVNGTEVDNFTDFLNNCLLQNGGCLVELDLKKHYENVIYNLVLLINDKLFDTMDIDNQNFIDYIEAESGLNKELYKHIFKELMEG